MSRFKSIYRNFKRIIIVKELTVVTDFNAYNYYNENFRQKKNQ